MNSHFIYPEDVSGDIKDEYLAYSMDGEQAVVFSLLSGEGVPVDIFPLKSHTLVYSKSTPSMSRMLVRASLLSEAFTRCISGDDTVSFLSNGDGAEILVMSPNEGAMLFAYFNKEADFHKRKPPVWMAGFTATEVDQLTKIFSSWAEAGIFKDEKLTPHPKEI